MKKYFWVAPSRWDFAAQFDGEAAKADGASESESEPSRGAESQA